MDLSRILPRELVNTHIVFKAPSGDLQSGVRTAKIPKHCRFPCGYRFVCCPRRCCAVYKREKWTIPWFTLLESNWTGRVRAVPPEMGTFLAIKLWTVSLAKGLCAKRCRLPEQPSNVMQITTNVCVLVPRKRCKARLNEREAPGASFGRANPASTPTSALLCPHTLSTLRYRTPKRRIWCSAVRTIQLCTQCHGNL
jgi:hypothetical protein